MSSESNKTSTIDPLSSEGSDRNPHMAYTINKDVEEAKQKFEKKMVDFRQEIAEMSLGSFKPKIKFYFPWGHWSRGADPKKTKEACLPLARIRKIMKSDEDVQKISVDAPMLFAKACELFIIDLTYRSQMITKKDKRKTISRADVEKCILSTDIHDFLTDLVAQEESTGQSSSGQNSKETKESKHRRIHSKSRKAGSKNKSNSGSNSVSQGIFQTSSEGSSNEGATDQPERQPVSAPHQGKSFVLFKPLTPQGIIYSPMPIFVPNQIGQMNQMMPHSQPFNLFIPGQNPSWDFKKT